MNIIEEALAIVTAGLRYIAGMGGSAHLSEDELSTIRSALTPAQVASPSVEGALAALETLSGYAIPFDATVRGEALPTGAQAAHDTIRSALTSAAQEDAAWREIGEWCNGKLRECRYARSGWHHFTLSVNGEVGGVLFQGESRLAAIVAAGQWCRAERGKVKGIK